LILIDANILIYAFRRDTDKHAAYRAWLEETLRRETVVGISDLVLSTVVRISTHPKIFIKPNTLDEVFQFADYIRSCTNVFGVVPGKTHWSIFQHLCSTVQARGNLITDAYLAALAIEKGAEWITSDRDFSRFPGLKWRAPI
jgi:toxin-antitoxin system PIN domain toxin